LTLPRHGGRRSVLRASHSFRFRCAFFSFCHVMSPRGRVRRVKNPAPKQTEWELNRRDRVAGGDRVRLPRTSIQSRGTLSFTPATPASPWRWAHAPRQRLTDRRAPGAAVSLRSGRQLPDGSRRFGKSDTSYFSFTSDFG
jgi:hypothetical protein